MSNPSNDHPKTAFVVIAEFTVRTGCMEQFLSLARADAHGSVTNEASCQHFDAVQPEASPDTIVLYEVYDDRAAFDAHRETAHYALFRDGVPQLTVGPPVVRFCTRLG